MDEHRKVSCQPLDRGCNNTSSTFVPLLPLQKEHFFYYTTGEEPEMTSTTGKEV